VICAASVPFSLMRIPWVRRFDDPEILIGGAAPASLKQEIKTAIEGAELHPGRDPESEIRNVPLCDSNDSAFSH
jgi:hypothetical protein